MGKGRGVGKLLEYGLHPDGYFSGMKSRSSSFDLNQNFCQEFRPICILIYNSDLSSLKLLLKHNVETQFGNGHAFCISNSKIYHTNALTLAIRLRQYNEAKLLLQTGSNFNWKELDRRQILKEFELLKANWFLNFLTTPLSLKHICRIEIRRLLKVPLKARVCLLKLPRALRNYLYMEDIL